MPCVVALEAAHRLAFRFAFRNTAGNVILRGLVNFGSDEDGLVECAVELTVSSAREPMAGLCLPGSGLDRSCSRKSSESGFAAAAAGVGPADHDLCGDEGANAGFFEQPRREVFDQWKHGCFELFAFASQLRDSVRCALQGELGPCPFSILRGLRPQALAAFEELSEGLLAELLTDVLWSGDDQGLEDVDRGNARDFRAVARDDEGPQAVAGAASPR